MIEIRARASVAVTLSIILSVVLTVCIPAAARAQPDDVPVTAVLGAMPVEVQPLLGRMADTEARTIQGIPFTTGTLHGRNVVVAETGVGKVNAAITTTLLIEHFHPSEILFTGIAGALSPGMAPGDVLIGQQTAQHDLGTIDVEGMSHWGARPAADTTRNPVFFPSDSMLLAIATSIAEAVALTDVAAVQRPARAAFGTVLTGDVFVASSTKKTELLAGMGGDAIEMEGAAVAQVCWQLGQTPLILIRGISDAADDSAYESATEFQRIAAENAATFTAAVVDALANRGAGSGNHRLRFHDPGDSYPAVRQPENRGANR